MNKPKVIHRGDKVAIVSLSSGMLGEAFCKHTLERGAKRIKEFGLEPVFMTNSLRGIEYLRNNPRARADDLKQAFMDDSIKGIICAIGGDDTYKILPYLLEDKEFIKKVKVDPKIFTGFSDTTIDHLMFYKLGVTTYYGPNFINDLAELADEMLPYTKNEFERYLNENQSSYIYSSGIWYEERTDFSESELGVNRISYTDDKGYELLQGEDNFSGKLLGGCLESIYEALVGERYENQKSICEKYNIFPAIEEWKGKILFLETSEEEVVPEILKTKLLELKSRGIFDVINGIIVGKPQNEKYYEEYKTIYLQVVDCPKLPIAYNFNFGHAYPRCVIPYGIEVEIDVKNNKIKFKESIFK